MNKPEVSVIVLSYNTKNITNKCLTELKSSVDFFQKKTSRKVEVLVVDNSSSDGSVETIKKNQSWVGLIESKTNLGFAKANNLGMKKSSAKYFLLLNSDAFVKKQTLYKAWRHLKKNRNIDILGCRLLFENNKFQPSGGYLPTPFRTIALMFGLDKLPVIRNLIGPIHPKLRSFFNSNNNLEWVMGAFMLLRREVFDITGGFDEMFFMYTEEVEWFKRMQKHKFKLSYKSDLAIVHLGSASSSDKATPIIQEAKGLLKYHQKHYPNSVCLIKATIKIGFALRFLIFSLLRDHRASIYRKALS